MKPSLLAITPYSLPVNRSFEADSLRFYRSLAAKGWRVEIHTTRDTPDKKRVLTARANIDGVTLIRHNQPSGWVLPNIEWQSLTSLVIHGPIQPSMLWLLIVVILRRLAILIVPTVTVIPEGAFLYQAAESHNYIRLCIRKLYAILLHMSGARVLAQTTYEAQCMTEAGLPENRISILPYGVNPDSVKAAKTGSRIHQYVKGVYPYVLVFSQRKHSASLKKFVGMIRNLPQRLTVVISNTEADGEYIRLLKKYFRNAHLYQHVSYAPFMPEQNISYLIRHARAVIFPSRELKTDRYILTSMRLGTYCITTDQSDPFHFIDNVRQGIRTDDNGYKTTFRTINSVLSGQKRRQKHHEALLFDPVETFAKVVSFKHRTGSSFPRQPGRKLSFSGNKPFLTDRTRLY